jgi:hypothetical protein
MAAVSQAIGTIHPPLCFAPIYTISALHIKRIFEPNPSRRPLKEPQKGRCTPR